MRYLILFCLFLFGLPVFGQRDSKLTKELLHSFNFQKEQACLLVLKDQKIVAPETTLSTTKEEKGKRVFEALKAHANTTQSRLKIWLKDRHISHKSHFLVNTIYLKAERSELLEISKFPEVKSIVHLPQTSIQSFESEEGIPETVEIVNTWGIDSIFAPQVWEMGIRGAGAVIGNQDTGVEWYHPGLKPKYRGFINDSTALHEYSWHDAIHWPEDTAGIRLNPCGYDVLEPCDDNGHGTHTMGTSVGNFQEFCFGVAPEAKWIACRNMDRGAGTPETYIECFEWFLAPTDNNDENPNPDMAPDVINNSWACPPNEGCNPQNFSFMEVAVQNLKSAGIVVVVSAGNSGSQGCGSISTPAAIFESSFTVGSIRQNDTLSGFSSIGPVTVDSSFILKPNVVAPGSNVRSSARNGEFRNNSGTSMAGPHVSGLVGLMVSANPMIRGQVDTIERIIEYTARHKTLGGRECLGYTGTEEVNHLYGHGRIDAYAAVLMAMQFDTNTVSSNQESSFSSIEIYPNPVGDFVRIQYPTDWIGSDIAIFASNGQRMRSGKIQNILRLEDFLPGVYYLHIRSKKENKIFKLVKI